ncbi:MAG: hypothetical protein WBG65_10400, partial [Sulfurimonadaceae bacterium]
ASIASARQKMLVTGTNAYPTALDAGVGTGAGVKLFDTNGSIQIMTYPVYSGSGSGDWIKTAANSYTFTVVETPVPFTYTAATGVFDCTHGSGNQEQIYCSRITE